MDYQLMREVLKIHGIDTPETEKEFGYIFGFKPEVLFNFKGYLDILPVQFMQGHCHENKKSVIHLFKSGENKLIKVQKLIPKDQTYSENESDEYDRGDSRQPYYSVESTITTTTLEEVL